MYSVVKKSVKFSILICLLLLSTFSFAQQYQIKNVEYDGKGRTLEYPLKKAVEIDFEIIFEDKESLDSYIENLSTQFNNLRVLDSAEITVTLGTPQNDIIPVDLFVYTVDSSNFIIFPMPKYSSSSGFSIKLDSKDYNFFGTMETFDAEFIYDYDFHDDKPNDHKIGTNLSYSYPFAMGPVDANWNNKFGLGYTIGDSAPNVNFSTGLGFSYSVSDYLGLSLSLSQGINYNQDYEGYGDELYFSEGASFSMPITLARTDNLGNLTWSPNISATYYWDIDGINKANEALYRPSLSFGHSFSFGSVNWVGNFKDGLSFSFSQSIKQDFYNNNFSSSSNIELQYFKAFEYVNIKSRAHLFYTKNTTRDYDGYLRGVHGSGVKSNTGLIINFDLPIKVWETDWVGYGAWDWMRYVDFEMQISPFIDIALGNNSKAGTNFSPKDGLYSAGIEIIGYPSKFRSVQGRISFGIDLVNFASKVGNRVDFVDKLVNKFFNTGWRNSNWYELSIGIGLFY